MPSKTARGFLSNGVNGHQGTLRSEELDGKEYRGALGDERDLELRGFAVSWNIVDLESTDLLTLSSTVWYYANFRNGVRLIGPTAVLLFQ